MEKRDLKIYATNLIKLKESRTLQPHLGRLNSMSMVHYQAIHPDIKKKAVLCTTL